MIDQRACCNAQLQIARFWRLGAPHKLAACKTLASTAFLPFLLHFSLICPKRPLPRLNRFSGPPSSRPLQIRSPSRPVLPVQQVTHCTRERIEDNIFGGRRKEGSSVSSYLAAGSNRQPSPRRQQTAPQRFRDRLHARRNAPRSASLRKQI